MASPVPDVSSVSATDERRPRPWDWTWGVLLLVVAGVFAFWAAGIEAPRVGGEHDLGPQVFPWLLCAGLAVCGAAELIRCGLRRAVRPTNEPVAPWPDVLAAVLATTLALLAIGLLQVPYSLATLALAIALLRRQGASWPMSLGGALLLVLWIKWMFGWGFQVQLEDGWIDRLLFRAGLAR